LIVLIKNGTKWTFLLKRRDGREILKKGAVPFKAVRMVSLSKIKHEVPQGSVLGPLLFFLYINDFPLAVNKSSTPTLFADDTSLVITDRKLNNIDAKLNINLQIVHKWFKSNLLYINF
jgi:hypothetical protein